MEYEQSAVCTHTAPRHMAEKLAFQMDLFLESQVERINSL